MHLQPSQQKLAQADKKWPNWEKIETVFLDLDGTLLDKHFDDFFWEHHLPSHYARVHGASFAEAQEKLLATYRKVENTLAWTDLDYWSGELEFDIVALKHQVADLIALRPATLSFLGQLASMPQQIILTTNAHPKSLALKMKRYDLSGFFSKILTSQQVGAAKEEQLFWQNLHRHLSYQPAATLLVDDTEKVLDSASSYGLGYLLHIAKPSSKDSACYSKKYPSIADFNELEPFSCHS